MTLSPGKRLGPYEVLSALGAGGMGEVYRAKDTRLDRTVAIKVLPPQSSATAALRERFEREARTISSLNHPHICVLYDVGREADTDYLVMEICEGETLAARLSKGPIPIDRLLQYSIQIADALDKAHRMGVVHRDLKPGNIILTKSGIKLLDFGLAKLRQQPSPAALDSRTQTTADPITEQGTILGTLHYMAPEQLEGKEVDARADIFSFGAVMYEMATGKKAFEGSSQASIMAAILEKDPPPLSSLQPMTPPALERVIKTCLAKDPDDRWQTASDLRRELQWIADASSHSAFASAAAPARPSIARPIWLAWGLAALFASLAAIFAFIHFGGKPLPSPKIVGVQVPLPEQASLLRTADLVLSPDGRRVVFPATGPDGVPHLWVQDFDGESARSLSQTDISSAVPPSFWSPDSRFVVYSGATKVRKVDVLSGAIQDVCDKPGPVVGGSWNRDGVIIFGSNITGLWKVPAGAATPVPLTKLDPKRRERDHELPTFLPDGRHFLYLRSSDDPAQSGIYVGSLDDPPDRQSSKRILATPYGVGFVPPQPDAPARILFFRDAALMAQDFDLGKLELRGDPSLIVQQVGEAFNTPEFSASSDLLVYRQASEPTQYQLTWFDETGKAIGKAGDPQEEFSNRQLSPDATRLAFSKQGLSPGSRDIWILDLNRGTTLRLTSGAAMNDFPVWSPDGREIVFSSIRNGPADLYRQRSDGSQPAQLLLRTDNDKRASSWSRDGRILLYESGKQFVNNHLFALPMTGQPKPILLSDSPFDQAFAQISPDNRSITYMSDESGGYEVYLQDFKMTGDSVTVGSKSIISQRGGWYPEWRSDGKEIVYLGERQTAAVAVSVENGQISGPSRTLFQLPADRGGTRILAPTADRKRFLIPVAVSSKGPQSFNLMVNWPSALQPK